MKLFSQVAGNRMYKRRIEEKITIEVKAKLQEKKDYYEDEIAKARKTLNDLQSNPAALEQFARERYLMKKDGEDIFILEDSTAVSK
jgi:cell division protein FtsB